MLHFITYIMSFLYWWCTISSLIVWVKHLSFRLIVRKGMELIAAQVFFSNMRLNTKTAKNEYFRIVLVFNAGEFPNPAYLPRGMYRVSIKLKIMNHKS